MTENRKPTQAQRVLDYIEQFGSITQYEALKDLGIMRLASRVSELKKNGHNITGHMVTVKNRFGENCSVKQYRMGGGADG
jgi:regulator of RNase E activity RraA